MKKALRLSALSLTVLLFFSANGQAQPGLEKIKLQLRWHHQFQFAGYYAAKHQGYYQQAGFDVDIIAGSPERQPVTELLKGNVDFAEGNSEVLHARLTGKPIIALAAIYQRSPSILLTKQSSSIRTVDDLKNKTVMLVDGRDSHDVDLLAMLHAAQTPIDDINIISSSYQINDLYNNHVDAFNSYLSNEPFYLEERGIKYNALKPSDYGIDFYSDILFTSEAMAKKHPDKVNRFMAASLKGWQYALNRPEEIIQIIKNDYQSEKSFNHLRFEANTVRELIMPELISIGHIHPRRLQHMAEVFQQLGMVEDTKKLNGFIFHPTSWQDRAIKFLPYIGGIILLMAIAICIQAYTKKRLLHEIERRRAAENKLKQLALTDHLTELHNTRSFHQLISAETKRSERSKHPFSLITLDIDFFKGINDQYGHHVGDEVLCHLTTTVASNLRESDMFARVGGEEFVIILPNTREQQAVELAERARKKIEDNPYQFDEIHIRLTASFGVTEWRLFDNTNDTMERADQALYQAKRNGRNQVQLYVDLPAASKA